MAPRPSSLVLLSLISIVSAAAAEALDPADEAFRAASYAQAWSGPLNADHSWSNLASGHAGKVRATKERVDPASHQPCREIREDIKAGEQPATGYAVGCRDTNGTWHIVQSSATTTLPGATASTIVPADVTPYVAPADINAAGNGGASDFSSLPPQVRILVPGNRLPGAVAPTGTTATPH